MTIDASWTLSPDEFAWLWSDTGLDRYPDPIAIIESAATADEYHQLVREFGVRFPRDSHNDPRPLLRAISEANIRITASGRIHGTADRVRSIAAATSEYNVIVTQTSSADPDFGGEVTVTAVPRRDLLHRFSLSLPAAPAGQAEQMIGYTPRVRGESSPTSWRVAADGHPAVEERIRAFLRLARSAEGALRIDHPRSTQPTYLSWVDIAPGHHTSGRYLIAVNETGTDTVILPAGVDTIASELRRRIQPR
ncbi:ESX secretion-associated protein EspG [Nocardia neocaledoniensis]|uniref:ESX secretion-associated protein EspG n=1 Tax=Nocardia neocaledoniensis TaxID=236511 RepID=UPI0024568DE9|nr:ESX secretion-associated protein EspG [Nocardia neocaledoniensis]